jgi:arylsulfatase
MENHKESKGEWPKLPTPPKGSPNLVVILLDNVGFGQVSTYGGPIPTPELEMLANQGLRCTRFHTTAISGPSRAALIKGRNHHNAGSGFTAEWATGFPSYNCMIPKSSGTIAATLKGNGYATSWFRKNHNTPDWESSVPGRFGIDTFGVGEDTGSPVSKNYKAPFSFKGVIHKVDIDLK